MALNRPMQGVRIPDTGSAGASFARAASEAAESSSDLTAAGGGDGALEAVLARPFLADSDGLNGGGATGSLEEESRVPDMTCALIDCGGGRYPALCPKPAQAHNTESRHARKLSGQWGRPMRTLFKREDGIQ